MLAQAIFDIGGYSRVELLLLLNDVKIPHQAKPSNFSLQTLSVNICNSLTRLATNLHLFRPLIA